MERNTVKRSLVVLALAASPVIVSATRQPAPAAQAAPQSSTAPAQPQAANPGTAYSRHHRNHGTSSGKHHRRHHHQTTTKQ